MNISYIAMILLIIFLYIFYNTAYTDVELYILTL